MSHYIYEKASWVPVQAAGHANFKKIYWLQQKQQEKELSTKSISESEKQELKVIKAIQEYENNFVFSLKRKSLLLHCFWMWRVHRV